MTRGEARTGYVAFAVPLNTALRTLDFHATGGSTNRGQFTISLYVAPGPVPLSGPPPTSAPLATPSPAPPVAPVVTAPPAPVTRNCCRVCTTGKACGNTCISRSFTCHVGVGCACDARDLDRRPRPVFVRASDHDLLALVLALLPADSEVTLVDDETWANLSDPDDAADADAGPCDDDTIARDEDSLKLAPVGRASA